MTQAERGCRPQFSPDLSENRFQFDMEFAAAWREGIFALLGAADLLLDRSDIGVAEESLRNQGSQPEHFLKRRARGGRHLQDQVALAEFRQETTAKRTEDAWPRAHRAPARAQSAHAASAPRIPKP